MRLPSGATAAPWFTSMPSITPTTLLVAGSMTWTLSPALLVWMMRTFVVRSCAARGAAREEYGDASRSVRRVALSASHDRQLLELPSTHAFSVCHSGSFCEVAVLAAVVEEIAARLFGERMHEQLALQAARHDRRAARRRSSCATPLRSRSCAPGASGCSRSGVPDAWHDDAARVPGTLREKDRLTFVLNTS